MHLQEKIAVVVEKGFPAEQAEEWFTKYSLHLQAARARDLDSVLTFSQYLDKVVNAGLTEPSSIGRRKGQHVLGRVGDVGNYTEESCRFITVEQNHKERFENGRHINGYRRRGDEMIGQTKDTSDRYRKSSEAKVGKTKLTDPGHARQAQAIAKTFVMVAPDGTEHQGTNLFEFCQKHGLSATGMYDVFAGRRKHHKGWKGSYVS
ncbi:hypothetical protein [Burkholderia phage FLC9]|nr:hypothetical protein [Burkholderia phage FLC9]